MKKVLKLKLDQNDSFFKGLREKLLANKSIKEYLSNDNIDHIIRGTFETLKEELKDQKPDYEGFYKFNFEKEPNIYPYYHSLLEENIDIQFNRRVHTTTLERYCDFVESFVLKTANQQAKDAKIKVTPLVDESHELKAITQYLADTWDGFDKVNPSDFCTKVWTQALDLTKNTFDRYAFLDLVEQLRENIDPVENTKSSNLVFKLMISHNNLSRAVKEDWNYEKNVNCIMAEVKKEFPECTKLKPKGWREMAKNYTDYQGMEELDSKQLQEDFKGMNSSTAVSAPFEIRVSLPYVMYDKDQGRKPLETLVGAMLGHAYVMAERNNASRMLKEWLPLSKTIRKGSDLDFKEPLNIATVQLINTENHKLEEAPQVLDILGIKKRKP